LGDIVEGVSQHVREFQELLPDFVCKEKITSMRMDSVKITSQKVVEKNPKKTAVYIAEYTNCRKFTTTVEIKQAP